MWPSLKTRPDCGCSTSAFAGDVLREGGERNARRVVDASSTRRGVFLRRRMTKKKRKTALAAPRTAAEGPGPAEVFFSRKMVNILNVDRHRQSVAWIK